MNPEINLPIDIQLCVSALGIVQPPLIRKEQTKILFVSALPWTTRSSAIRRQRRLSDHGEFNRKSLGEDTTTILQEGYRAPK